jgi:hypothetical protein
LQPLTAADKTQSGISDTVGLQVFFLSLLLGTFLDALITEFDACAFFLCVLNSTASIQYTSPYFFLPCLPQDSRKLPAEKIFSFLAATRKSRLRRGVIDCSKRASEAINGLSSACIIVKL